MSDASLAALLCSAGTLVPDFDPNVFAYTAQAINLTQTVRFTPTATDGTATITVAGVDVTSGSSSADINLPVGSTPYDIVVTGSDTVTVLTYTVTVARPSVSGTINAQKTVRDHIGDAMKLIGVYDNGTNAEAFDDGLQLLQDMLQAWQLDGCNLWRIEERQVAWPANAKSQTFDPNVMDVQDAMYQTSATYERQLGRYEYGDYKVLPNKVAQGTPTIYATLKRVGPMEMFIWPVPVRPITLNCTVARYFDDVTDLNQTLDLPPELAEVVKYNLADRMLDPFSVVDSQPGVARRIQGRATTLYGAMRDADRPGSVMMRPWDMR